MRVALLAPFEETVPPFKYGGTELVVHCLCEELVRQGHDVTLYAAKGSSTSATLISCVDEPVRTSKQALNPKSRQAENLRGLINAIVHIRNENFDIVHNHFGWQAMLFQKLFAAPMVTTVHGTLADPIEHYMYGMNKDMPFVSISDSQRKHAPELNYVATVYNGIGLQDFIYNEQPHDYLAFLGRVHPQKGLEYAIEVAHKAGRQLIIGAKVDPEEETYFKQVIRPLIDGKQIRYLGEVTPGERAVLLKNAYALIAPIQWDEPFGMVNIESLASGTPVISIRRGSLPEIIQDGKNGFLCNTPDEMVEAVSKIGQISRRACRQHVEEHFTAKSMTDHYLAAYRKVIAQNS